MTDAPSRHALIIEDDMVIGLDMQGVLSELGFASFAFAATGDQALDQALRRRPDLVTADLELLDGDGRDACRALEAACGRLPIVYVTGRAERLEGEPGLTVVAKPFTAAQIASACRNVLAA